MNPFQQQILFMARRFCRLTANYQMPTAKELPSIEGQPVSNLISSMIERTEGVLITRFGSVEAETLLRYLEMQSRFSRIQRIISFVRGEIGPYWWDATIRSQLFNNAGFFPVDDDESLDRFAKIYLECCRQIDVLGVWSCTPYISRLSGYYNNVVKVPLRDLEPYYHQLPWTHSLENRRVLVIHPFVKTIEKQFLKRDKLFVNSQVLPRFELIPFQAVQSIAGNQTEYGTWFEALNDMCQRIQRIDFDVAIIGAGAYGMPLAAFVKSIGKKAIHLGGATQILFGIKGARWDQRVEYTQLYNEHWVRPDSSEVPTHFQRVENGCYW